MKNIRAYFSALFLFGCVSLFAQETYTVSGESYSLKTEVEGPLTLLWNVIDGEYRYFAKKKTTIVELTNTRDDGKYCEEYKATLDSLTSDYPTSTKKTNLTLVGLRQFFNTYNEKADPDYETNTSSVALDLLFGVFGGFSNNTATTNPENILAPLYGAEFEVTDNQLLRRHSMVLQFRQSVVMADYELYFSQFALNYRFKVLYSEKFALFAQAKLITLTFFTRDENNEEGLKNNTGSTLQSPVGIGLGADYKIGGGYLTLGLNDLVSPGLDTNGSFPVDVTLGYKFRL